jgi:hypothetical protein
MTALRLETGLMDESTGLMDESSRSMLEAVRKCAEEPMRPVLDARAALADRLRGDRGCEIMRSICSRLEIHFTGGCGGWVWSHCRLTMVVTTTVSLQLCLRICGPTIAGRDINGNSVLNQCLTTLVSQLRLTTTVA